MQPEVAAFLRLIAWSEGTATNRLTRHDGYDVIVSGPDGLEVFTDFSHHPFQGRAPKLVRPGLKSTASGRYQHLLWVWQAYSKQFALPDFSPASQDAVAVQQLQETRALPFILVGKIDQAIARASSIWASLPGNDYKQNAHPLPVLMAQWEAINQAKQQEAA